MSCQGCGPLRGVESQLQAPREAGDAAADREVKNARGVVYSPRTTPFLLLLWEGSRNRDVFSGGSWIRQERIPYSQVPEGHQKQELQH